MCGWGADVGSSGDNGDPWRSGSEGWEGEDRSHGSLWLHKNRPQSEQYMVFSFTGNLSQFYSYPDLTAKRKKTDLTLELSDLSHLSISGFQCGQFPVILTLFIPLIPCEAWHYSQTLTPIHTQTQCRTLI